MYPSAAKLLAENNGGASWADYIFANCVRLARGSSINAPNDSSATIYYHSDQLSSTRLLTDSGAMLFLPMSFIHLARWPQPSGQNHYLYTGKGNDTRIGCDSPRNRGGSRYQGVLGCNLSFSE